MNKIKLFLSNIDEMLFDIPNGFSLADEDEQIICAFAKRAHKILEIGTCWGRTTANLAKFSPNDAIVYSIDKEDKVNPILMSYPFSNKIRLIKDNSFYYDFIRNGMSDLDLIFIDGSHAKTSVYADTRISMQLIAREGIIVWHDFAMKDNVGEYVFDYFSEFTIKPKILTRDLGYFSFNTEVEL